MVLLPVFVRLRRRGRTKSGLRKKVYGAGMSQLEPPTAPVGTPEVSKKKPFYKRKWFIALAILMLIGAFASDSESSETKTEKKVVTTTEANTPAAPNETVSESNVVTTTEANTPAAPNETVSESNVVTTTEANTPAAPKETVSESNARKKAASYLKSSAFSRSGLIKQLEYEGFSNQDATYGADAVGANWNEQAAKKAASYLKSSAFSRSGLIKQLEYEGFTTAQAEYGVSTTGL